MSAPGFIIEWARLPGPSKVLGLARERKEQGRLGQRARLDLELSTSERLEVGRMLDAAWAGSGEAVSVAQLRRGLAVHGITLETLFETVSGPLRDLRAERGRLRQKRLSDQDQALRMLTQLGQDTPDAEVLRRCLVGAELWTERAEAIVHVIQHVDALVRTGSAPIRLGVLAASLFGDAHHLDRNSGLGRAVARFLQGRVAAEGEPYIDPIGDAAAWHATWASCGVICDGVSARVLVLNLPLTGDGPAARMAQIPGEPVWLTLRSLRQVFGLADDVEEVFVCENPAIVEAAADRYGVASKPLICTFGNPDLATTTLLETLAGFARLRVRADGDRVGWQIVERLLRLPGAAPWRMPPGFDRYEEEILDELLSDLAP